MRQLLWAETEATIESLLPSIARGEKHVQELAETTKGKKDRIRGWKRP